jgi:hypothetical protein
MKISSRQRLKLAGQGCLLLLLSFGLFVSSSGSPSAVALARVSVIQSVTQDAIPVLKMSTLPSPTSVQEFAKATLNKLAAEAPFTAWKDAGIEYYPLGPGTHGWLVNVMKGEERIGYMIISATDTGGYMLSEYGAGTYGLPYSLNDLRQFLVQNGLITSSFSGTIKLTALYAPLLPVWKITIDEKTVYINASVPQILPWTLSKAEEVLKEQPQTTDVITNLNPDVSPLSAFNSGGSDDPYEDILWLTAPKLTTVGGDNIALLIRPKESIAYQAAGRNDLVGAPFMITGYQSWQPSHGQAENNKLTVYAASGPEGKRYLPLTALQNNGTLHKLPDRTTKALGYNR